MGKTKCLELAVVVAFFSFALLSQSGNATKRQSSLSAALGEVFPPIPPSQPPAIPSTTAARPVTRTRDVATKPVLLVNATHESGRNNATSTTTLWQDVTASKKTLAVLIVVFAGIFIGCAINFVNLHTDFQDLQDFHRGYLGRRLLIREGKLQSRRYVEAIKKVQSQAITSPTSDFVGLGNGHIKDRNLILIQEEIRKQNPHCHSNFVAFTSVAPFSGSEPVGEPEHLDWLAQHLPLYASQYIEDHDPEWKDLDYSIEVGSPPTDFLQFIRQYDWSLYYCDRAWLTSNDEHDLEVCEHNEEQLHLRRCLLYQFRKWKKRRRRLFNIVVTERAKKEMAAQDHTISGGGGGGGPRR